MFFHIDESGNTGLNLFDKNQPVLSYGMLSSKLNVDALGIQAHRAICKNLKVKDLHANQLGVDQLTIVAPDLYRLHQKMKFSFDYYFIDKYSYAIVQFFEAVFDQGLNPTVPRHTYWTQLRYVMIFKLSSILTEELLIESNRLCDHKNIASEEEAIIQLLSSVLTLNEASNLDDRTKEIIRDALNYGIGHPLELDFGNYDPRISSPNAVCFQFISSAIARRLQKNKRKSAMSIVVDRQSEFNKTQQQTFDYQAQIGEGMKNATEKERKFFLSQPLHTDLDEQHVLRKNLHPHELKNLASEDSIGLQIVDIYLWIANRIFSEKPLSDELRSLGYIFLKNSITDNISLKGMETRFKNFESSMPKLDELSEEQLNLSSSFVEKGRVENRKLFQK